jgi:hypothetical protein
MKILALIFLAVSVHAQGLKLINPFWNTSAPANGLLTGILAYYKFDEAVGSALDSTGNGRHLTQNGIIAPGTGVLNGSRVLESAIPEWWSIGDAAYQEPASAFSWSCWFRCASVPSGDYVELLSHADFSAGQQAYFLRLIDSGGLKLEFTVYDALDTSSFALDLSPTPAFATNVWYFVCLTSDASERKIYLGQGGGALETSTYVEDEVFPLRNPTGDWSIGALNGGLQTLDGEVDESGFWSVKLTPTQVGVLYGSGTPPAYGTFD